MPLTLFHKCLIRVSIPLCFEIKIFGVLINLQNQAEAEAQRIGRNKEINGDVNTVNTIMNNGRWQFGSSKGAITIKAKLASDISILENRAGDEKPVKTETYRLLIFSGAAIENLVRDNNDFNGNAKGNIFIPASIWLPC